MKYYTVTGEHAVIVQPETVEECGLFQWLAKRYEGKSVTLHFDTTLLNDKPHEPMLWIKPIYPQSDES